MGGVEASDDVAEPPFRASFALGVVKGAVEGGPVGDFESVFARVAIWRVRFDEGVLPLDRGGACATAPSFRPSADGRFWRGYGRPEEVDSKSLSVLV